MGIQSFISVPVMPNIMSIFDEFIRAKEITKTAALTDLLELYMLSVDENLYLELKKKHLNVEEVKEMILSKSLKIEETTFISETFLFMKLGDTLGHNNAPYNGPNTINAYIDDEATRGYTWFGTDSLYFGMSQKQVKFFKRQIKQGQIVKILFAIGKAAGGNNDIQYSAEVLDIESSQTSIPVPESNACPHFFNSDARIWIKIRNIREEHILKAHDLIIKSSGSVLKDVISNGQFHFGYVVKR